MKSGFIVITFLGLFFPLYSNIQPGICCVPIADLTMQRPQSEKPIGTIGMAPETDYNSTLNRVSQLCLNDPVFITEEKNNHYIVTVPGRYYGTSPTKKNNSFWIEKQAITRREHEIHAHKRVYTLIPLFIPELACTISAGTCFTLHTDSSDHYMCSSIHPPTKKEIKVLLPKKYCCLPYKNPQDRRAAFVKIVRYWAQQKPKKIPYVLGGSTIIDLCTPNNFTLAPSSRKNNKVYMRPEAQPPYTGLDCAHLVFLAARTSGISITGTNTLALMQELKPLGMREYPQAGDIALWKGHVIIITDTKKGLLAEARGYPSGYGIVQEIPFSEQFKNIATTDQLVNAYRTKKPIMRLNKEGRGVQIITDLKLYKLPI